MRRVEQICVRNFGDTNCPEAGAILWSVSAWNTYESHCTSANYWNWEADYANDNLALALSTGRRQSRGQSLYYTRQIFRQASSMGLSPAVLVLLKSSTSSSTVNEREETSGFVKILTRRGTDGKIAQFQTNSIWPHGARGRSYACPVRFLINLLC